MNVLFVGPYRQPDMWGSLSRSMISSLLSIKEIELTTRPIFLATSSLPTPNLDPNIFKCESNKKESYDVLIQHTLPHFMVGSEIFDLNIGVTSFETKGNVEWDNHLKILDKILVSTQAEKKCVSKHLRDRVRVIGGAIPEVDNSIDPLPNRFCFYCFGGNIETKGGLLPLLQAYLSEFHVNENISLVIHTNNAPEAQTLINDTVSTLGIYGQRYYPHIHLVTDNPDDSVHKQCQCLVDTSITRGFKEEVARALSYGNTPIILEGTGMDEYVNDSNGWVVKSNESLLVCPDRPIPNAFTARESCLIADKLHLRKCLRNAFDNRLLQKQKSSKGKECSASFSVDRQRDLIKEALCL